MTVFCTNTDVTQDTSSQVVSWVTSPPLPMRKAAKEKYCTCQTQIQTPNPVKRNLLHLQKSGKFLCTLRAAVKRCHSSGSALPPPWQKGPGETRACSSPGNSDCVKSGSARMTAMVSLGCPWQPLPDRWEGEMRDPRNRSTGYTSPFVPLSLLHARGIIPHQHCSSVWPLAVTAACAQRERDDCFSVSSAGPCASTQTKSSGTWHTLQPMLNCRTTIQICPRKRVLGSAHLPVALCTGTGFLLPNQMDAVPQNLGSVPPVSLPAS